MKTEIETEDLEQLIRTIKMFAMPVSLGWTDEQKEVLNRCEDLIKPCPFYEGEDIWVGGNKDGWRERKFIRMEGGIFFCVGKNGYIKCWTYAQRMTEWITHDGKGVPDIEGQYKFILVLFKDRHVETIECRSGKNWGKDSQIVGYKVIR